MLGLLGIFIIDFWSSTEICNSDFGQLSYGFKLQIRFHTGLDIIPSLFSSDNNLFLYFLMVFLRLEFEPIVASAVFGSKINYF